MDISSFALNLDSVEGKWFTYPGTDGKTRFKIAYFARGEFNRVSAKIGKRYPKQALEMDPALVTVMTIEIMADAVLMDWEGVEKNGVKLEPTKANKIEVLGIQPIREWISRQSEELTNFTMEAEAEDATALKSGN